jgi:hypothetical protein
MICAVKKATMLSGVAVMVGILLLIPTLAAAQDSGASLHGTAEAGYRFRTDGVHSDSDFIERLSLQGYAPWKTLGEGAAVGFVFSGQLQEDVDGKTPEGRYDPFRDIADTSDQPAVGWIYLAYAEMTRPGPLQLLRVGRQDLFELLPIPFDGGLVTVQPSAKVHFNLTGFGGIPSNIFENPDQRRGDYMAGGYLDWRPCRTLSFRAGYVSLRDRVETFYGAEETLDEGLSILQGAWFPRPGDIVISRLTFRETELRDATVRASHRDENLNLNLSAFYTGQYVAREAAPLTDDPFALLLGDLQPYNLGGIALYKGIGERLGVEAGAVARGLSRDNTENLYNHSYQRYLVTFYLNKVPLAKSQVSIGMDWWVAEASHVETQSVHAEYEQKFGSHGFFRAGTAYALYQVDEWTGQEQEHAQTYFVDLGIPAGKKLLFLAGYSFEDSSLREVDTFRARVRYEF